MERNHLSPAGCRRHTRALAWVRELDEGFEGTDKRPGEVLSIVKKAAAYLGMSFEHEVLLDKMFMLTQAQDWTGATPVGPVVFGSNSFYADELNRSERSIKRLLTDLIELGLIAPRDSANGRRWGRRDEQGQLTEAYGFSLAPAAVRYDELAEAAGRRIADRKERGRLKATITREKKRIAAAAAKAEAGWDLFRAWLEEVATIVAQRARAGLKRLRDLAARITALRVEAEAAAELSLGPDARSAWITAADRPDGERAGENEREMHTRPVGTQPLTPMSELHTSPQGVTDDTRITATQQIPSLRDSCGSQAGEEWSRPWLSGPSPELVVTEDFEEYGITAAMVVGLVTQPSLGDLGRDPDWSVAYAEAEQLAHARGLDRRMIGQLEAVIGRRGVAVAVITTARKADRWEVRNEGGYLRRMLEIAKVGELRMGKTVWGLVRTAESEREATDA